MLTKGQQFGKVVRGLTVGPEAPPPRFWRGRAPPALPKAREGGSGAPAGLVADHGIGLPRHVLQVRDAQLSALEQVLDVRAGLLERQEARIARPGTEEALGHLHQRERLMADVQHLAEPPLVMAHDARDPTVEILWDRRRPGEQAPAETPAPDGERRGEPPVEWQRLDYLFTSGRRSGSGNEPPVS